MKGETGGFVQPNEAVRSAVRNSPRPQETTFNVATLPPSVSSSQINTITTTAVNPLNFAMNPIITAPITTTPTAPAKPAVAPPAPGGAGSDGMSTAVAAQIKAFTGGWGKGQGSGVGTRSREFEFTAYIGQYNGGNWSSTVRISPGQ